jgi:hypothetical protein
VSLGEVLGVSKFSSRSQLQGFATAQAHDVNQLPLYRLLVSAYVFLTLQRNGDAHGNGHFGLIDRIIRTPISGCGRSCAWK